MRLATATFEFLQFADVHGQFVIVRGLPLLARFEFRALHDRLVSLIGAASPDSTFQALYDQSPEIRHLVATCLKLFHIEADRLSIDMVQQLLIARRDEDGRYRAGWLVELEFPPPPADQPMSSEEPPTDAEILAALWSHTGDLSKAIELGSDPRVAGRLLLDTLSARSLSQDEKVSKRQEFKKWADVARAQSQNHSDWRSIADQVLDQKRRKFE
jgi:hypothetical protein